MLFNSIDFLIFFPVVVILYYSLSHKWRIYLLLIASYYFYMCWKVEYILLIIISTFVDYYAGIQMSRTKVRQKKRNFLILSLVTNLGILVGFKYFNFFSESVRDIFNNFNIFLDVPYFNVLLPVGISFYTFQTLSYSIDIYYGRRDAEKNFGVFALYVAFFPQLVAGPIERSTNLIPQFKKKISLEYTNVVEGLKQILWGFFKKLVVADRLAIYVNAVYNNQEHHSGISLIVATIFFGFQIYCDFSGYSDIAIGSARIMGINLMENFKRPYFSRSIKEFWSRWHISLSSWFRDYLYIPLGGNRVAKWRWYFNLFMTFLISGLWHGANWTFIIWGAIHGIYYVISDWFGLDRLSEIKYNGNNLFTSIKNSILIILTYIIANFAWIFFRANNVSDAFSILNTIFSGSMGKLFTGGGDPENFYYGILAIIMLLFVDFKLEFFNEKIKLFHHQNVYIRYASYAIVISIILIMGVFGGGQFIYFQF